MAWCPQPVAPLFQHLCDMAGHLLRHEPLVQEELQIASLVFPDYPGGTMLWDWSVKMSRVFPGHPVLCPSLCFHAAASYSSAPVTARADISLWSHSQPHFMAAVTAAPGD